MEDKMFELMEKLYGEFSLFRNETNKRLDTMDKRFDFLESDVKGIKKDILRIENDLKPKAEAALDGYKAVYEKLQELQTEVKEISRKVETQEGELRLLRNIK